MATRTISTKLAIQGESEYKAALSRINNELKTLQSGLKLTESEFKGQANSMEALRAKGEALAKMQEGQAKKVEELAKAFENAQKAVEQYAQKKEELSRKIDENNKKLEELRASAGDTAQAEEELTAANEKLNAELTENEKYLEAAQKGANDWQTSLNNAQADLNELNDAINQNNQHLEEAASSADGCASSIDEFGNKTKTSADAASELQQALGAAGLLMALDALVEGFRQCADASIEFESAIAGVAKTSNMNEVELGLMSDAIKNLATEIPATTTEIAGVAEAAGQLGIKKDDILNFTEVMINLGTATNLSADEAASALAKFANVVGMSATDYDRLGSTIVALGNNFATTETDIVNMSTRLASAGSLVGLTEAEIMGVATALSSLGIEAEAGGSAMATLLKKFETMVATGSPALQGFAEVAGMSADEFAAAWGEDAVGALSAFIDGLGAVDEAGGSSVAVLDDLGIKELRLSNAVQALSTSHGLLADAVDTANGAWKNNTALAKEAETRYNTTESKLQMLENSFNNVKIAIGDQLTPAFQGLIDKVTEVLDWIGQFIEDNKGIVPVLSGVVTGLGVLVGGIGLYVGATEAAIAIQKAFNAILNTNPIYLAVTAVGALTTALITMSSMIEDEAAQSIKDLYDAAADMDKTFDDAEKKYQETVAGYQGSADMARKYVDELKALEAQGLNTEESQRKYAVIVDKLNTLMPDLNLTINEQTHLLDQNYDSIYKDIDAWEKYYTNAAGVEQYNAVLEEHGKLKWKIAENQVYLNQTEEDLSNVQTRKKEVQEQLNKEEEKYQANLKADIQATGDLGGAMGRNNETVKSLQDELASLNAREEELTTAKEKYTAAIEDATEKADAQEATLEHLKKTQEEANKTTEEGAGAQDKQNEALIKNKQAAEALSDQIQTLADAYTKASESARQSLDSQFGLFEKVEEAAETSIGVMQEALDSQESYWKSYVELVDGLCGRNVEGIESIVAALADGSPESKRQLEAMSNASDTELTKMVESFNKLDGLKGNISDKLGAVSKEVLGLMDQLGTDFKDKVLALGGPDVKPDFTVLMNAVSTAITGVKTEMETGGADAAEGFNQGVEGGKEGAATAAEGLGNALIDALRGVLDEHSPSVVMHEIGANAGEGLKEGIEESSDNVVGAVEQMGADLKTAAETAAQETVDAFDNEFKLITDKTQTQIDNLISAFDKMDTLPDKMKTVGGDIVDGMIAGIKNKEGALYDKITAVVNAAMKSAKSAADSNSPSKKTIRLFEDVGEGMIVGLENKRRKIAETAQSVVSRALEIDIRNNSAIERLIASIDSRLPDLTAPSFVTNQNSSDASTNIGDIYVEVNMPQTSGSSALEIGREIGYEIKRQMRYKGVM